MQPLSEYPTSDSDNESGKNRSTFHRSVSMSTGAPWARNSNDGRVVMMRKRNNSSSEMNNGTILFYMIITNTLDGEINFS